MTDIKQSVGTTRIGKRQVLYDAHLVQQPDEQLFVPELSNIMNTDSENIGRAAVVMHHYQGLEMVSKHYHRGGMIASLLGDAYFGINAENSRSFREWCMLSVMRQQGLPVPVPIAASVIASGLFYTADLVTLRIPRCITLAEACAGDGVERDAWFRIGSTIARFHGHNAYHADLNARNIMLGRKGAVHLLDFDKGCFRLVGKSWRNSNLARLKRSLLKFRVSDPAFSFDEADWRSLLDGYTAA